MVHDLKIEENYLLNLLSGEKRVEIRFNDRDYQKHDLLKFRELLPTGEPYEHLFEIRHIHSGLGLKEGYVALSVFHIQGDK